LNDLSKINLRLNALTVYRMLLQDETIARFARVLNAAQSGVAIDILVPGKSDYAMVGFATRSYYETLLSYGIKVHEYVDTFVHSKILIVDDELASVGSVNFDPRSFHLNFEATAVFENAAVHDLVAAFAADLEKAPAIDMEQWKQRGMLKRLLQGLFNLFSPLF